MPVQLLKYVLLILPMACFADTTLDYASSKDSQAGMSIQIKDGDVLMGAEGSKALYKAGSHEIVVIDHAQRNFMVIDDAAAQKMNDQVSAMQEQMNAMMAQMQKQMADMTPEQRAQIEQAMRQQMPGMATEPPETSVQRMGKDSVSGIPCEKILVKAGGRPAHEACVASADALGIPAEDYRSMLAAMDAMQEIMRKMSAGLGVLPINVRQLNGIPVRMKNLDDGSTSSLTARSDASLDAGLFEVPAGYSRRELMQ